jgi:integrase/recombinase XerD
MSSRPAKRSKQGFDPLGKLGTSEMVVRAREYSEWMLMRNFSERTVRGREDALARLIAWCQERGLSETREVTKPILERYQRHLYHYRKTNGRPLSFSTQNARLSPVRAFFKWLTRQNYILMNPASEIELPKLGVRLPKHVLSAREAERVMTQPDLIGDPLRNCTCEA